MAASYTFNTDEDTETRRRRRRLNIADLLMKNADAAPIQSPWQGAAKMASAGISGFLLGREEKRDREASEARNAYGSKLSEELGSFGGGGGGSPVTAALAGKPFSVPEGRGAAAPAELGPLFDEASKATGIPAPILMAKARQESNFNPGAIGGAGEIGVTQILPSTARDPGFGMQGVDPSALRDPKTNIMFGAQYLAARARAAGVKDWNDPQQVAKALTAYNGGGDPNYAQNVMRYTPNGMFKVGGSSGDTTLAGGDTLQGRGMPDANRLMQIATDRNAPPEIRERAKLMLQSMPKPRDPLDEEIKREQLRKMRDPQEQKQRELAIQKAERELQGEGATPLTDAERQQYGIPKGQAAYKTRDGGIKFGPAGTTVKSEGAIPPGHRAIRDVDGNIMSVEPIPGSKEAKAAINKDRQQKTYANIVVGAIDDIDTKLATAKIPPTGFFGGVSSKIPGTASHDIANLVDTIKANISFERLNEMKAASPTGGALGAVSDQENKLLQRSLASLEQSQSPEQFRKNLDTVKNLYLDIVHGPGNRPASPADELKKKYGLE
jgi:hypothetical protein